MQSKLSVLRFFNFIAIVLILPNTESASIKDVLKLNGEEISPRVPRDNKYYPTSNINRYRPSSTNLNPLNRPIKPEDSPESHESTQTPVEKRCTRCDYDNRSRYDYGRYRDRFYDDDRRYDRYDDRRYDRYDDRDRYYDRRLPSSNDRYYDRYDRDRYDDRDRDRDRYSDRDRDRYSDRDRYDRDGYRDYDRGYGYDNRGYDYRERYDGYRPWDETYRGSSGWDGNGRGYYFATGRPEVGAGSYWGTGGGYASGWNYGGNRDYDRGNSNYYRPKDPYDGYRGTSYLYGRPSSTTTDNPSNSNDNNGATQSSQQQQQDNNSG